MCKLLWRLKKDLKATLASKHTNSHIFQVPKPLAQLRQLNWTPVPPARIPKTVWEGVADEKLYDQLDLPKLCAQFAATKESNAAEPSAQAPGRRFFRTELAPSVLEPRRAQNCTIMLSKLKLSHREIRNCVMSMDEKGKLPRDMLEQVSVLNLIGNMFSRNSRSSGLDALDFGAAR